MSSIDIISHSVKDHQCHEITPPSCMPHIKLETLPTVIFNGYSEKFRVITKSVRNECSSHMISYAYPFKGLFYVLTKPVYWRYILLFGASYSVIFFTVAVILYMVLLPLILAGAIVVFGPIGFILVHIQWLLLSNSMTNFVCKKMILSNLSHQIFKMTIILENEELLVKTRKKIKCKDLKKVVLDPSFQIYVTGISVVKDSIWSCVLTSISLIPLLGPLFVNQLSSVNRSFNYLRFYLFNMRNLTFQQATHYKYSHLVSFICFGMSAGLLEFLPILSIVTMMSNIVGAALWSLSLIPKDELLD